MAVARNFTATARIAYDAHHYVGSYPDGGDAPYLWHHGADMHAVAGEFTLTRRLARRHMDTGGTVVGMYAQDEARVAG